MVWHLARPAITRAGLFLPQCGDRGESNVPPRKLMYCTLQGLLREAVDFVCVVAYYLAGLLLADVFCVRLFARFDDVKSEAAIEH